MGFVQGIAEINEDLAKIGHNFRENGWQFAKTVSDEWAFMIHLTDAIDTGDMLRAVNWHPQETGGDLQQFIVDVSDNSNVNYEGFVEGGTKFMAARFPAQKGIERVDFAQSITSFVEGGLSRSK